MQSQNSNSSSMYNSIDDQYDSLIFESPLSSPNQSNDSWINSEISIPMNTSLDQLPMGEPITSDTQSSAATSYEDYSSNNRINQQEVENRMNSMEIDMHRLIIENERLKNQIHSLENILEDQLYKKKVASKKLNNNINNNTVTTVATTAAITRCDASTVREDLSQEKPKGRYWSTDEHERFMQAIERFGTRDIKTISIFVGTRTPTQVRTHLQKFLLRLKKQNTSNPVHMLNCTASFDSTSTDSSANIPMGIPTTSSYDAPQRSSDAINMSTNVKFPDMTVSISDAPKYRIMNHNNQDNTIPYGSVYIPTSNSNPMAQQANSNAYINNYNNMNNYNRMYKNEDIYYHSCPHAMIATQV
ncbi:hypothetical protein WA158_007465 [Blastocystis sp. Blastoise]